MHVPNKIFVPLWPFAYYAAPSIAMFYLYNHDPQLVGSPPYQKKKNKKTKNSIIKTVADMPIDTINQIPIHSGGSKSLTNAPSVHNGY